jgi:hypothetical protein
MADEENAASTGTEFRRIQVRNGIEIKGFSAVLQDNFQAILPKEALNHDRVLDNSSMGVPNDIIRCLIYGQDDTVGCGVVESCTMADGFDERTSKGQQTKLTGDRQGPGGGFGGHPVGPAKVHGRRVLLDYTRRKKTPQAI